jgi:predicted aminopeptidase
VIAPRPPCLVLAAVLITALGGCHTAAYLAQQGRGQLRLMQQRRRIADVLADPNVGTETKRRLLLATRAREFGIRSLGLSSSAYTRYLDTHDAPVAWMVSAAPKDRLVPHLTRFPLVGSLPYLGFFREEDARREVAFLERQGLDTYVRPVAGFSTLGITSDPIYSSMLEGSDARIVEITLHEMVHGTVFVPGHAEWNESVATFIGLHGAVAFLDARGQGGAIAALMAEARGHQRAEQRFSEFLQPVIRELEALYARPISRSEKLRLREPILARARAEYLRLFPPAPGKLPGPFAREPLNNAVIVAYAVYHQATPEHRRRLERLRGDLAALVRLYRHAVQHHRDVPGYLRRF